MLTSLKGKEYKKTYVLAFFIMLAAAADTPAQQQSVLNYPVINQLNPSDIGFRQFINDVQANRRRLVGARADLQLAAENLTIYQYTVRQNEDIFFLAARCNIPYSALVTLNRLNNPRALETGQLLLLPSCPGIFIPDNIESDLEKIIGVSWLNDESLVEIKIRKQGRVQDFSFIPGADFSPTERGFFLHSGFRFPLRSWRLTSAFGMRPDPFTGHQSMHRGIDLAAPEGTEVFAAADGVVTSIGDDPVYGIFVIITHNNNWTSLYGHLQKVETVLRSQVKSGTLIGRVGSTGLSTGPHLHFELRQGGIPFDPQGRLRP